MNIKKTVIHGNLRTPEWYEVRIGDKKHTCTEKQEVGEWIKSIWTGEQDEFGFGYQLPAEIYFGYGLDEKSLYCRYEVI